MQGRVPPFCSWAAATLVYLRAPSSTLFTERNIANQFVSNDINAVSALSYPVSELGVEHVIVMGHYGCGGVGASILARPAENISYADGAVQNWIEPIRHLFQTSTRPEIVKLREFNTANNVTEEPEFGDPGYRALVEENVKESVCNIANDLVMQAHWDSFNLEQKGGSNPVARKKRSGGESGPLRPVFVHGFVYDISNGQISDLGISVGPPGFPPQFCGEASRRLH
ncbi:carbonic anhydrase [Thelephora terrestris]|uniref:Carbonic anhydrase n=1 Tax=Thelephora terrestris TaxID=56493 RepID=A0A9P6HIJ4_9AGAM|nr:carbonic anhydrase [Thelephora terrestris]